MSLETQHAQQLQPEKTAFAEARGTDRDIYGWIVDEMVNMMSLGDLMQFSRHNSGGDDVATLRDSASNTGFKYNFT